MNPVPWRDQFLWDLHLAFDSAGRVMYQAAAALVMQFVKWDQVGPYFTSRIGESQVGLGVVPQLEGDRLVWRVRLVIDGVRYFSTSTGTEQSQARGLLATAWMDMTTHDDPRPDVLHALRAAAMSLGWSGQPLTPEEFRRALQAGIGRAKA